MKEYDVIIVGSGAGATLIGDALSHGKSVALVDKGPAGGTCLNVGCIPSKMLIFPADRIMEIRESGKLGIKADIAQIDFTAIMERTRASVKRSRDRIQEAFDKAADFDYYHGEAFFIDDYTLQVNDTRIRAKMIFLASGARPHIPKIKGIESIEYLTNESVFSLVKRPESLVIIGGGYIAVEFAHFFEAMGTTVTIIQKNSRLVPEEEPGISDLLKKSLSRRMTIHTHTEAREVQQTGNRTTIVSRDTRNGKVRETTAEQVLIAAGRTSNADALMVGKTGVKTNAAGYIVVDDFFETTKPGIWAFGDAIGKKMFRHAANHEVELVWHNAVHGKKSRMNYLTVPHAVFSWPEIASVGLTQAEAVKLLGQEHLLVGKALFSEVARGEAMQEHEGFAVAIVHRKSGKIIGYHLIGPQASILIQEVVNVMAADGNIWSLANGMHIHPSLSEVVLKPFSKLDKVESSGS